MRRKDDTLQGVLLSLARKCVETEGVSALNMRLLAQKAGVAVGTVYNYFAGKEELLLALTELYWEETLRDLEKSLVPGTICGQLQQIYGFIKTRMDSPGGQLMHSLGSLEKDGLKRMAGMQGALEAIVFRQIERDPMIPGHIWDSVFTKQQYAQFLVMHMMVQLRMQAPEISFLTALVRRTVCRAEQEGS